MDDSLITGKFYKTLLQEGSKVFHRLIEESQAGVYLADEQGNLIYVNPSFASILGYVDRSELIGKNLAKELYVNPANREVFLKEIETKGAVRDYQVLNRRKDGSIVILSVTSNRVMDEINHTIGMQGIVHDITDKKRMEDELKEEKDRLVEVLNFEERLNALHDIKRMARFIVDETSVILKSSKCSLMFYDHNKQELFVQASKGLGKTFCQAREKMGESMAGLVAQRQQPALVVNIEYDNDFKRANRPSYRTRSCMIAPIMFGFRLLGVINVADKQGSLPEAFTELDLRMLIVMAKAVGVALENAELFGQMEIIAGKSII